MIKVERKPIMIVETYKATIEFDKEYPVIIKKVITTDKTKYEVNVDGEHNPFLSDIVQGYVDNQISKNLLTI